MKKIAFIVRLFQIKDFYAGGEKFIYKIIQKFIENNYKVDVWCKETDQKTAAGINEIIQYEIMEDNLEISINETKYSEIQQLIKEKEYDFVIYDGVVPFADNMLLQVYSKAFNIYNIFQKIYYHFKPTKLQHIIYEQKCLKQKHNKIFVVSNHLKNDLIKKFDVPENQIGVIYPGVDPVEVQIEKTKDNNSFCFGISATFFKRKGGLIFLTALIIAKLKGYDLKAKMILRNSSNKKGILKFLKIFNINENIEFLSFQKDMTDFYSKIDCLVMPSIQEAFGLVALEGMINKLPVIVSDCSGIAEIIENNNNGFVFKMDFMAALNLANIMINVEKNPDAVSKITQSAYETAQNYTWDRTFAKLEQELNNQPISGKIYK